MKINKPENCINVDGRRKIFIGFNKEDYEYCTNVMMNARKHSSYFETDENGEKKLCHRKMPRMTFFIVLHYNMNFVDAYRALEFLIRRIRYYNKLDRHEQLRVVLLNLGQDYIKTHFIDIMRQFNLIGNGVKFIGNHSLWMTGTRGFDYSVCYRKACGIKVGITVDISLSYCRYYDTILYSHIYSTEVWNNIDKQFDDLMVYINQYKDKLVKINGESIPDPKIAESLKEDLRSISIRRNALRINMDVKYGYNPSELSGLEKEKLTEYYRKENNSINNRRNFISQANLDPHKHCGYSKICIGLDNKSYCAGCPILDKAYIYDDDLYNKIEKDGEVY